MGLRNIKVTKVMTLDTWESFEKYTDNKKCAVLSGFFDRPDKIIKFIQSHFSGAFEIVNVSAGDRDCRKWYEVLKQGELGAGARERMFCFKCGLEIN